MIGNMLPANLKVYRLAWRLYFGRASPLTRLSCAARLFRGRFLSARAPISTMIGLTYRCQCRCVHCGMELKRAAGQELTLAEVKGVIGQARRLGAVEITLFGGEPLLRKDIVEIVAAARDLRMLPSIDTNGLLLTKDLVERLAEAGLGAVKVSLDSSRPEVHDRLRGSPGCFEKAIAGFRRCREASLPCVISTYATKENLENGELERLIARGRELGVDAVRVLDTTLSGCFLSSPALLLDRAARARLAGLIEPGFVFLENLASAKKLTHPVCSAVSRRYLYVSPVGDVQPCCFVPLAFGNVREKPLREILAGMWGSEIMDYGAGDCLMNNPRFREKYHARIASAAALPLREEGKQ